MNIILLIDDFPTYNDDDTGRTKETPDRIQV